MKIHTSLSPSDPLPGEAIDVAVVIDVLRATTVAATALAAGAAELITCREVKAARLLSIARHEQALAPALLCGERGCRPIEGFDLGNSPAEYTHQRVAGRTLILTTTNGTAAIESASSAHSMVLASFLNRMAVVESLLGSSSVHLVCAGTDGRTTGEDVLLAGAIVALCRQRLQADCQICDASAIAAQWWAAAANSTEQTLAQCLAMTAGGRNLVRLGYAVDLDCCAALDVLDVLPTRRSLDPATFSIG